MAKTKKTAVTGKVLSLDKKGAEKLKQLAEEITGTDPEIEIMEATIKDDFCNYTYVGQQQTKIGKQAASFTHGVKGKGIVDQDMIDAFEKLNVHLAVIDDIYKHSGIEIKNLNAMHADELAGLYQVTGFKIKGAKGNESVILIGNKYLSGGDRMEMDTPKKHFDNLSSYKWWEELAEALEECRAEVLAYHNGKFTVPEKTVNMDESDAKQLNIGSPEAKFDQPGEEDQQDTGKPSPGDLMAEFNAK